MDDYLIYFRGLSKGKHDFFWKVGTSFFENDEYDTLQDVDVMVTVEMLKKETSMEFTFSFLGKVFHPCDRCLQPVEIEIDRKELILAKEVDKIEFSNDENLIFYDKNTQFLDFYLFVREIIFLSLPMRIVHPEGQCDPEMEKILESLAPKGEQLLFNQIIRKNG